MPPESGKIDSPAPGPETETTKGGAKRPIAFLIPGLEGGGAQRVFVTLVNTLVSMTDHPIHLVTSRRGGVFEHLVDDRVIRVVLGPKHVSRSIFRLAAYIRSERPIAMISTLDYCNVIFLLSTLLTRVPFRKVIREANVLREEQGLLPVGIKATIMRTLMRVTYHWATDLIIITEDIADSLTARRIGLTSKMHRIANPVSRDQSANGSNQPPSKAPHAGPFVLGIGRLSYQKGFDTLLRAFAQLPNHNMDLVVLGDGPLRSELQGLANDLRVLDRVKFLGFVANPAWYLKHASLFVLSSRWEGFSNVLVEALAVGIPIVSTDCPGSPREVLEGGRLGRLVPVDNVHQMTRAMDLELRSPIATPSARMYKAKAYSHDRIAAQYLRVLLGDPAHGQPDLAN